MQGIVQWDSCLQDPLNTTLSSVVRLYSCNTSWSGRQKLSTGNVLSSEIFFMCPEIRTLWKNLIATYRTQVSEKSVWWACWEFFLAICFIGHNCWAFDVKGKWITYRPVLKMWPAFSFFSAKRILLMRYSLEVIRPVGEGAVGDEPSTGPRAIHSKFRAVDWYAKTDFTQGMRFWHKLARR